MKKEYKDLEIETVTFEAEDVITASGIGCGGDAQMSCDCDFDNVSCDCVRDDCSCYRAMK